MKNYQIWSEGYLVSGMDGIPQGAIYFGTEKGESFKDACIKFFTKDNTHKNYFNADRMCYWGCKLFDNEVDARKSFG